MWINLKQVHKSTMQNKHTQNSFALKNNIIGVYCETIDQFSKDRTMQLVQNN